MSSNIQRAIKSIQEIQKKVNISALADELKKSENKIHEAAPVIPIGNPYTDEGQKTRIDFVKTHINKPIDYIIGKKKFEKHETLKGNIENFIGMAQIPIGLAGPVKINGTEAIGDFYIPLATTEGALVASYSRGMHACSKAGGIRSVCLVEGIQRSPFFKFENLYNSGQFVGWLLSNFDNYVEIIGKLSRFAKLDDLKINVEGNSVIATFEFRTGDAAGQNMVTICTQAICEYIVMNCPIKPVEWFVESNYSGDKKATALSFTNVRGKKVTSEINLSKDVVEKYLRTTPEKISHYWIASTLAVIQSGSIGAQGHVANGLTALFIACGQDVACIAEASVGVTRMEVTENGGLYASVTLPNLIVGTVGGGTHLPTQRECLELIDCYGSGKAKKFAEICCAVSLAGELSIAAAISSGQFAQAHKKLGRK